MKLTNLLIAILFLAVTVSCKKSDEKPVYKFYVKLNGKDYFTNQDTYDNEVKYIRYCYYSSYGGGKGRVYFQVYEPTNGKNINFSIYIDDITSPKKVYTLNSTSSSYATYYMNSSDSPSNDAFGTFEITDLTLNSSTFKLSSFSAKFDLTQTAEHADGYTYTTTLKEGEINKVGLID